MKISYDCEELIKEIKQDIAEFGNIDMYAYFKKIEGYLLLVDYDFIDETNDIPDDLKNYEFVQIMKAKEILEIFEKENLIV